MSSSDRLNFTHAAHQGKAVIYPEPELESVSMESRFESEKHGFLGIALSKRPGSPNIHSNLTLKSRSGKKYQTENKVSVSNYDADFQQPSLSFGIIDFPNGIIDFPKEMRGKGIGYVYMSELGRVGKDIQADTISINDFGSPKLEKICKESGMNCSGWNWYGDSGMIQNKAKNYSENYKEKKQIWYKI